MTARVDPPGTTFVTVVFEPELPLLELQARSMARFLDPEYAERIIVLDNTDRGISAPVWKRLLRQYGEFAARVELVGSAQLASAVSASGWYSQQVLKLTVSAIVATPTYVTLDSKNHFVRAAGRADFEGTDGRAFGNFHGYQTHPHRASLERVLAYEGLDPAVYIPRFGATATPFTLYTGRVRELVVDIEKSSGFPFPAEFVRAGLTEYFLYSAWLVANGEQLEKLYDAAGVVCPTVWPRGATAGGVARAVDEVHAKDSALFSVHRTALARMGGPAVAVLAAFWAERGLFASPGEARAFVRSYRARYYPVVAVKKLRDRVRSRRTAKVG